MSKHAFTLMELLISIVLLTLITFFLIGAIGTTKKTNNTLIKHDKKDEKRALIFDLLYKDLLQSYDMNVSDTRDRRFQVIQLQTSNSLYNIPVPYVTYYVNSQSNELIRLEAAKNIKLPIPYEDENFIHADVILHDVQDFNLYKSALKTPTPIPDTNTTKNVLQEHLFYLNSRLWPIPMLFVLKL